MLHYCKHCRMTVNEADTFCRGCGKPLGEQPKKADVQCAQHTKTAVAKKKTVKAKKARKNPFSRLNIAMVIWSIVNTVFGNSLFSVAALIFSLLPDEQSPVNARKYNRLSLVFNILCTVAFVITVISTAVYIGFLLLVAVASSLLSPAFESAVPTISNILQF